MKAKFDNTGKRPFKIGDRVKDIHGTKGKIIDIRNGDKPYLVSADSNKSSYMPFDSTEITFSDEDSSTHSDE